MSLIVTVWTNEGIVMGSDSRISFSSQIAPTIPINIQTGHYFDTQEKTFLCLNGCGISTCGAASLQNKNITGFIKNFIENNVTKDKSIQDTANLLKSFIESIDFSVEVHFFVAGYVLLPNGDKRQDVYSVITGVNGNITYLSTNSCGAQWDGEIDTLSRILKGHYLCRQAMDVSDLSINTPKGNVKIQNAWILPKNETVILPENQIAWNLMTLQDAIDFVRYAINITIDTMRFILCF